MKLKISQETLVSILIVVLLTSQVFISFAIVNRIDDLETLVRLNSSNSFPDVPTPPSFVEGVSIDDDPWKGTEDAPITIVEFADYQCPFCAEIAPTVDEILADYEGQIRFVYRDLPLEDIHPDAFKAAEAANCAGEQGKYWEMHDLLFSNQLALDLDALQEYAASLELDMQQFNHCLDTGKYEAEIRHDMVQASEYQVSSTPTFFVNGQRILGSNPVVLRSLVQNMLEGEVE